MTAAKLSFKDFGVRYKNIRKRNPNVKKCSVYGCSNPRDSTLIGEDTCCAYHRLLFDFWSCEIAQPPKDKMSILEYSQKGRRRAFTNWRNKMGKEALDKLVLKMAQEPINWEC